MLQVAPIAPTSALLWKEMWDLTESGYHDNKEDSEMDGHAETSCSMAHT